MMEPVSKVKMFPDENKKSNYKIPKDERLAILKQYYFEKLITSQEYEERRKQIIDEE